MVSVLITYEIKKFRASLLELTFSTIHVLYRFVLGIITLCVINCVPIIAQHVPIKPLLERMWTSG